MVHENLVRRTVHFYSLNFQRLDSIELMYLIPVWLIPVVTVYRCIIMSVNCTVSGANTMFQVVL